MDKIFEAIKAALEWYRLRLSGRPVFEKTEEGEDGKAMGEAPTPQ